MCMGPFWPARMPPKVVSGLAVHAYTTSKHAVVGLSNNLCVELGQCGIRVNCISPFGVGTGMLDLGIVGGRARRLN